MANTPKQQGPQTARGSAQEGEQDRPTLVFPQVARLELEELLTQLVDRAEEVLRTQGRLRALLRANQIVAADLNLHSVLRHIVEAARDLVDARYAALGVLGPDGQLAQFVHSGMEAETAEGIGHLSAHKGILSALIEDARTVRVADLSSDAPSVGLASAPPTMHSFLGVPLRSRGEVFGYVYLTEKSSGAAFTAEDEELVQALANAAAVSIDNARMYEETSLRQRWQELSVETTAALLSGLDDGAAGLEVVVRHAARLANADAGLIALVMSHGSQSLRITATSGANVAPLLHREVDFAGSLAERTLHLAGPLCLAGEELRESRAAADCPPQASAVLSVPLFARQRPLGVLTLGNFAVGASYDNRTVEMVAGFAAQAAVALELAQARNYREQLIALSGREDLIRELNDRVIGRLFSIGLQMHGLAAALSDADQAERAAAVVGELDLAIHDIRDAVFHLSF